LETKALLLENSPPEWNKPFLNMIAYGKTSLSRPLKEIEHQISRLKSMKSGLLGL